MNLLETQIQCPYCWETLTIFVDPSQDDQEYVEDCQVCCAPILINCAVYDGELVNISARKENE